MKSFQIPFIPHPSPYSLKWLNSSSPLEVLSHALVSLSIGPFYVKILCDALPMSSCHILLGRLWKFDHQVIQDGLLNEYSFSLERRKVKLLPPTPTEIMLDQEKREQRKDMKEDENKRQ